MKLKEFQDQFQRAILQRDDAILGHIPDGPRETKENLLGIYRDAYILRLIDVVANDHELLKAYLGEDRFRVMARAYIDSCPSHNPNARWFAHKLPEFLKANEPCSRQPVLAELAALERSLNDAFDGIDARALSMAELAELPPEAWAQLTFVCHPTALSMDVYTNAPEIWTALKAGREPPPCKLDHDARRILVWRHEMTSMFRELAPEEAMMWSEMAKGTRFGALCEMLAMYDDPPEAPARAAGYLKAWLDAGLLAETVLGK